VCAVVTTDGNIWVANMGDSLCYLGYSNASKGKLCEHLSVNHNLNAPGGKTDLKRNRGHFKLTEDRDRLTRDNGASSINMTRSLGDYETSSLLRVPSVNSTRFSHITEPFLILASDGVWDTIDPHEAVEIVRKYYPDVQKGATELVKYASEQWEQRSTRKDDIVALVVDLELFKPKSKRRARRWSG